MYFKKTNKNLGLRSKLKTQIGRILQYIKRLKSVLTKQSKNRLFSII
jgi:hypothetical protein